MPDLLEIGPALARLRHRQGFTQQEVAERIDRHVASVSRMESIYVNPSLETIYRYLQAIECTLWDLVELLEPDRRPEPRNDTWENRMEQIARRVFAEEMAKLADGIGTLPPGGRGSSDAGR